MRALLVISLAYLALAGCATPYQESGLLGGVSSQRLTSDTFMVTASGNGYTSAATIQQYVLRKAAETAREGGHEWFLLLSSQDASVAGTVNLPGRSTSQTNANINAFGNVSATTTTTYTPGQSIPYFKPGAIATFRAGSGPRPLGAMDASEVLVNLKPPPKNASVRQEDLDAWRDQPVALLDNHPLFRGIRSVRSQLADGSELRDYANGDSRGACHNRFYVKSGVVLRYEAVPSGKFKCFTDERVRPGAR